MMALSEELSQPGHEVGPQKVRVLSTGAHHELPRNHR